MSDPIIQSKVKALRWLRRVHRWMGIPLIVFFLVIGITSILLAWKKKGELLPPTLKTKVDQGQWISPDEMVRISELEMEKIGESIEVDRIDIRPDKGVAKVTFKTHFTEVQLDGLSGEVLSIETRHSDWIEKVHDGSIIDFYFWENENAKLTYSTLTALGLILMSLSGFYLWYYPKVVRNLKIKIKNNRL
ncbi:PepSY-associated TM region [Algoriphagus alkaliphilus]|uniref:PepSY-associated TM region n=1 Tax=Algoriphagus alkaliphilus TaxID=279824 RepID=A0A1G5Z9T7_9BACT|nr:PepSY-associated TM helix domain-containing protein [Algoriphagus alkaliphilus]SDA91514.1 PepSY-associated TM region [Algoriphagus alkaliphilus]